VKCTFSLLTSRLQCLRRLYSLKPWVCVSVLLSDYWPSIRRRIKPLCLLCFFCLLTFWPVSAVRAQEPTPTNTLEPFYTAPTPGPDVNYSCPDGIPEGWGQYEPDPTWLFHCSQCLPPGDGYEWGDPPDGWDDLPEGWPTPSPATPTPTPTLIPSLNTIASLRKLMSVYLQDITPGVEYHLNHSGSKSQWTSYTTQIYFNDTQGSPQNSVDYTITIKLEHMLTHGGATSTYAGYNMNYFYQYSNHRCSDGLDICYPGANCINIPKYGDEVLYYYGHDLQTGGAWQGELIIFATCKGSDNATVTDFSIYDRYEGFLTGTLAKNWYWTWWPGEYDPTIPEPQPSYCDTVLPLGSGDDDDDNFSLPGFWFGDMQCFTLGGFDIPLEWLNIFFEGAQIVDWTMPGMQFCFQSIHFDNLTLFGLVINLDWIALAMGGVVLFRFLTRS